MDHSQKYHFGFLFHGKFLYKKIAWTGKQVYGLYDKSQHCMYHFSDKQITAIQKQYPNIFKKNKKQQYTLNLNTVRGINKNSWLYQLYKNYRHGKEHSNHGSGAAAR